MDTTNLLIIAQVILLLLAGIIFLALYARKQKKAVSDLQDLLLEYKEDLSGDNLTRYFQLSIDDTTAHSSQETVALKPDAEPDQLAISLRYHGLANELALLQTYNGELSPWKSAIEPYTELADKIHDYIQQVPEAVKAELIPKIDGLENQLAEVRSQYEQAKNQLDHYHQLDSVYKEASKEEVDKQQLEIQLHHALLALAEDLENAAALREVIYLMHEGYLNSKDTDHSESPAEMAAPMEPEAADNGEDQISEEDAQAMHDLIEKFTEESAELVERIYMLNNENKMLSSENEDLKKQIKAYTEQEDADEETAPIIAGLKMKIESQMEEILKLQSNFTRLEDKYLSLYAEKIDASERAENPDSAIAAQTTDSNDTDNDITEDDAQKPIESEPEPEPEPEPEQDIASEHDIDDILVSAGGTSTADKESAQGESEQEPDKKDLVDTDIDENIDPDAILAEMDEINFDTEKKAAGEQEPEDNDKQP